MLSLKPNLISRYLDLAGLLYKYGRGDVAREAGLPEALADYSSSFDSDEHEATGPKDFARDLEQRGPTFVKLGQLLSTRSDLLPEPYLEQLTRLQDNVEPVPFDEVQQIITEELGIRLSRGFRSFDEKPLAAASLGQVYRAELRDGRQVVVKVQRPGIRQRIITDLEAFTELAEFLDDHTSFGREMGIVDIVNSLHETILEELDYLQEAENARKLKANLSQFERFLVPQPVADYCSSRVITMDYVAGVKITDVSPAVLLEVDCEALAEELFQVYLHQVLVDGCFHSDPHPGNLLLTRDHRIALMDFGMVTRVPPQLQQLLLRLLMAIADGLGKNAGQIAVKIGRPREGFDEVEFIRRISSLVTEYQHKNMNELEAGRVVMDIQAAAGQCRLRVPHELTMLGKTLLHLDKVVSTLSPRFDPNAAFRRRAATIMQQQTRKQFSLSAGVQALLEATEFAQRLPARANRITELLANNELTVNVNALDEQRLMSGMQKIANRITTGLVLAALIIGASMLMHIDSTFTFVMATIFFLLAAGSGMLLVFRAMFSDESHPPTRK